MTGEAELLDALFSYLPHALSCQAHIGAYLLQAALWATDAEALRDDVALAAPEHAVEVGNGLRQKELIFNFYLAFTVSY